MRAGRKRNELDVVASACCVIDDDAAQAKRWAAGLVAFYASVRTYEAFLRLPTVRSRGGIDPRALPGRRHHRDGRRLTDEMVDALTLSGTIDDVRAGLRRYEGLADGVKLSPPTHLVPEDVTRHAQARILEDLCP